ncbi:hypothetical protein DPMN_006727, partial [Dreissena polymorpha]
MDIDEVLIVDEDDISSTHSAFVPLLGICLLNVDGMRVHIQRQMITVFQILSASKSSAGCFGTTYTLALSVKPSVQIAVQKTNRFSTLLSTFKSKT